MTQTHPDTVNPLATTPFASSAVDIAVAHGDGIGPEIMRAVLRILKAAGARLNQHTIEIGEKKYLSGVTSGIDAESWDVLRKTRVFLKAPITTPSGSGYKSLNVTTRKTLGLFANVRRCVSYHPFVETRFPKMDLIIVRENEEDTYAGIEHRQTAEVTQCLKLISRPGCERVIRYAFDLAVREGRKKVTCMVKDNIMKITDGLFYEVFQEIAAEYPQIGTERMIIDIGTALVADQPERFDVIVTPNLYGDIISDVAAQVSGSVGLGGSANIGDGCAMFEAVHGSAPQLAGRNCANPSGLLLSAVMMLNHLHQHEAATRVHNAWLKTIEEGVHTFDIHDENTSIGAPAETDVFADAVIARLGQKPAKLAAVAYEVAPAASATQAPGVVTGRSVKPVKQLVGVDLFLDWDEASRDATVLGATLETLADGMGLKLKMITNRGVKVYPGGFPETFCTDHWRSRFVAAQGQAVTPQAVIGLLAAAAAAGLDAIKTENLYTFDGKPGYSLGQGE